MNEKLRNLALPALRIIRYPDPRLRETCTAVGEISDPLRELIDRMFELMHEARGVGLAAPQVGVTIRLFIACPTGDPTDRRVYINPRVTAVEGAQEGEEGCLSFPGIFCKVKRANFAVVEAVDLEGKAFEETGEGLLARIFQHETEHLDGRLLVDRMGSVAKLAHRRALRELEEKFAGVAEG